ncbi:MAG: DUF3863 domain-containing protein [FCB group bacterium]|jgi:hypothetical protein|nr:DUF3863 domain-containing protein [FCB group bacterium]
MAHGAEDAKPVNALLGNRYLTFNSVIRVNQIEAGREQLIGHDEAHLHTPEAVQAFRDAFEKGWPGGKMTWAFSWLALQDPRDNYKAIRALIKGFHAQYGDDVTFIPGAYFANMYNSRDQVNRDLHDGLALVTEMVGDGYRPSSVVAGFLSADNQRYLAEREGIHVCQGTIWSQFGIDNGDGDGSVSYPYYPSKEHFCKPAQGPADFIDCVTLDGWTCDFVSARRLGMGKDYNSRMGVGPIETYMNLGAETGLKQSMATTAVHFDTGFDLNGFGWVTNCWEASLVTLQPERTAEHLNCLTRWLEGVRKRWPDAQCVTQGDFGLQWRKHHKDNGDLDYRFEQRGTGINGSDANLEIRWFMNRDFRLALLRDWQADTPAQVIDFTRYDIPADEPKDLGRNWSLLNRVNQKQTRPEDTPRPLNELEKGDLDLILRRYPELA